MPEFAKPAGVRVFLGAGVLLLTALAPRAGETSLREKGTAEFYRGNLTAAAKTFEAAARSTPGDPVGLLDAAVVYRDLDDSQRSWELFGEAARSAPHDSAVLAALGWSAMRTGRASEARKAFQTARVITPDHPQAMLGLAHLELRLKDYSAALETAKRLTDVRPDLTLGHVLAGRALAQLGRTQEAAKAYTDAFESDNSYSEVRLWLGPLYKKLHRYNDAWRQYAKVLFVSPRHAGAILAKKKLASKITQKPDQIIPTQKQVRHLPVNISQEAKTMPILRVGVGTTSKGNPAPKRVVAFNSNGPFLVLDPETRRVLMEGPAQKVWTARRVHQGKGWVYELLDEKMRRKMTFRKVISVRPQDMRNHSMLFQRLDIGSGTVWEFKGDRQLKGTVEIRALASQGLYLVNQVPLEDYIYGVINQEMPSRYPREALKAQAVIARNQALQAKSYRQHHRHAYDLCDGQHCQVYSGVTGEADSGRDAVNATRGLVLRYDGRLAHTPYSSNCGGHTQDSGEVPGWSKLKYLQGRTDDKNGKVERKSPWELELWLKTRPEVFCNNPKYMQSSQFRWSRILSANEQGDRIRQRTKKFGLLRKIRILRRSSSGNVNKIEFRGTRGRYIVDREHRIRGILGVGSARSTMFTLEVDHDVNGAPSEIFIYGGGWGHGIGLCQIGTAGRATHGQDFREILSHYFPGTKVESLDYQ